MTQSTIAISIGDVYGDTTYSVHRKMTMLLEKRHEHAHLHLIEKPDSTEKTATVILAQLYARTTPLLGESKSRSKKHDFLPIWLFMTPDGFLFHDHQGKDPYLNGARAQVAEVQLPESEITVTVPGEHADQDVIIPKGNGHRIVSTASSLPNPT